MKKIMITGKGSYIGSNLLQLLEKQMHEYTVTELDLQSDEWLLQEFPKVDIIFHVAGIAHLKESEKNKQLYYSVNRDLAFEIAKSAKAVGVKQFIFMSSMSVYGLIHQEECITIATEPRPITNYGKSKLEAEHLIQTLEDDNFKVCILRPPMVYGENSPGNMTKLVSLVERLRIFPKIENQRSYISIEVLINYVKDIIDYYQSGIFFPQNEEYMCTYKSIKKIMENNQRKVIYIRLLNPLIHFLIGKVDLVSKIFGDLKYEKN